MKYMILATTALFVIKVADIAQISWFFVLLPAILGVWLRILAIAVLAWMSRRS